MAKRITKLYIVGDNTTATSLVVGTGATQLRGTGSTTSSTSTLYSAPASTTLSGSNNYYFNYLEVPATTGSTSGAGFTLWINGPPANVGSGFALWSNAGLNRFVGGLSCTGVGSTSGALASFYSAPASTTLSGSNSYFFNLFNTPSTSGSTTGAASTVQINGAPAGATTSYAFQVVGGLSRFGDTVRIDKTGSTTVSGGNFYIIPANTVMTGANDYYYTVFATPPAIGSTTGTASTVYIGGAPAGATNSYSLNVNGGITRFGGGILIPTGASNGYVLTSDANGSATWQASSGFSGFASGTAGSPGAYFSSDTNTGFYSIGADQIGISTGGTLRTTISTTALTTADGQILNVGTTGTTSTLNVYGASNLRGITALTGVGSTTASSATFYSAPASTAMTGSNTYFFNYMDTPTTTGSTTGTTTTLYVNKGPTASATPYAIQTPIDATNRFSGSMIYDRRSVYRANLTNSGTASQSGTTVTGSATSFDSEDLYGLIIFSTGESGVILSVNSATSLTLSSSQTVSSTTFSIYSGLVLDTGGVMYSAKFRNTATLYGQGSTLPNEGCLYIESGAFTSTTLTGSDNYYFTYINTPATTGSTTGTASTVYIHGAPAGATNSYSLNINSGISNFGDQVYLSAGSASAPSITFTGDTNTGIYNSATDTVAISSNGADKLTVAPSLISLLTTMTAPLVYSFNLASPTLTASADNVINSLVLNTSGQNIYLLSIFGTTDGGATRHALIGFYGVSSITGATRTWWSAITTIGSNIGAPNIFSSGQTIATYNAGSSPSQVISTNGGTAFDSLEFKSLRIL